ncbi:hypothetical protein VNO78_11921 [Psophocarpus tetragonolobus]|uniref:Transmembrane protein n=1 Tax=Psophocarpus tetragonolobus TaxID=3891 RepID=A0AAN9SUP1_PSOTE
MRPASQKWGYIRIITGTILGGILGFYVMHRLESDYKDEPVCMTPFNFDFEQHALTEEQMKELIYREALAFNPEYQQ